MSETVAKKKFIQTNQQCYFDRTVWPAGEVFDCCYHPTEPVLACGLSTGIIRLFRLKNSTWTLEQEFQAETQSHISCLAYNKDGSRLAAGCFDGTVLLWWVDADGGKSSHSEVKGHYISVFGIKWNSNWNNNNIFATRSRDEGSIQRLLVWDSEQGEELQLMRQLELDSKFIWDFEWISSTRLAACSFNGEIIICHIGRRSPVKRVHQPGVWRVCWHSGLNLMISCSSDGLIEARSIRDCQVVNQYVTENRIYSIDCPDDSNSTLMACGIEDGSIVIWDLKNNTSHVLKGHQDVVWRVLFSPDGKCLASMDLEEKVIIWSTENWEIVFEYDKLNCINWNHLRWNGNSNKLAISNCTAEVFIVESVDEPFRLFQK